MLELAEARSPTSKAKLDFQTHVAVDILCVVSSAASVFQVLMHVLHGFTALGFLFRSG